MPQPSRCCHQRSADENRLELSPAISGQEMDAHDAYMLMNVFTCQTPKYTNALHYMQSARRQGRDLRNRKVYEFILLFMPGCRATGCCWWSSAQCQSHMHYNSTQGNSGTTQVATLVHSLHASRVHCAATSMHVRLQAPLTNAVPEMHRARRLVQTDSSNSSSCCWQVVAHAGSACKQPPGSSRCLACCCAAARPPWPCCCIRCCHCCC